MHHLSKIWTHWWALLIFLAIATCVLTDPVHAQLSCQGVEAQPATIAGAQTRLYKSVAGHALRLHIFSPIESGTGRQSAVVFYFGGAWMLGSVDQFAPQARHLAERGMVAILADYRVLCRHRSTPADSTADGVDALRYIRAHAAEFNIDPHRIVAAGASSGGQIAIAAGAANQSNALILFSPGLDLSAPTVQTILRDHFGASVATSSVPLSPLRLPLVDVPTLILGAENDGLTPLTKARDYCNRPRVNTGNCEVVSHPSSDHMFFLPTAEDGKWYKQTVDEMDRFLMKLGYLPTRVPQYFPDSRIP